MSRARHKGMGAAAKLNRAEGAGVGVDLVAGNPKVVKEVREKRKRGGKVMPVGGVKGMARQDRATRKGSTAATTSGGLYSSASKVVAKPRGGNTPNC